MTWAEFRIRLFAYKRKEKNEWIKIRELAWASTIGPHLDPKKLPKSKNEFMPIDGEKSGPTEAMIQRMKEVREQYLKEINQ